MVWYGMVWYGMVDVCRWYGTVWYGMVWYGRCLQMVWYGMVWYGTVEVCRWYGMVWYGMVDAVSLVQRDARPVEDRTSIVELGRQSRCTAIVRRILRKSSMAKHSLSRQRQSWNLFVFGSAERCCCYWTVPTAPHMFAEPMLTTAYRYLHLALPLSDLTTAYRYLHLALPLSDLVRGRVSHLTL